MTSMAADDFVDAFFLIPDESLNSNNGKTIGIDFDVGIRDMVPFTDTGSPQDLTTTGPDGYLVGYWKMGDAIAASAYPIHPISLYSESLNVRI